ncbi:MAG: phosphatase PAP2 family protein [Anaerolineae bacterium]|nr:phosphatase PAP2 family protein [Anaerolineae bacterium]
MLAFETSFLVLIQSLGVWLLPFMRFFSFLGQEECYMLVIPLVYWTVDAALGLRLFVVLILSNAVNVFLKWAFHLPRPYWVERRVVAWGHETSFGLPSGHAQNAASVYGLFAFVAQRRLLRFLVVFGIFLIGFSRLYLGVHYLRDVLAGWGIGLVLLLCVLRVEERVVVWAKKQTPGRIFLYLFISSLFLLFFLLGFLQLFQGIPLPQMWVDNALVQWPNEPIAPYASESAATLAGTWLGALGGAVWFYHRYGSFRTDGAMKQKILRYLVGMIGLFVLWAGLRAAFPSSADSVGMVLRFLRYAVVGLWTTALAPLVFEKLGLVHHARHTESE